MGWKTGKLFSAFLSVPTNLRGPSRGSDLLKVTSSLEVESEPWSQSPVRQATRLTLLSCSGLAVNWGPLCSLAGHGVEKPCEAGSAIPQPPVDTGLLPGFFPPGPGCWHLHHSATTSGACHQAWDVRDPPSLGLSPTFPQLILPVGW